MDMILINDLNFNYLELEDWYFSIELNNNL